MGVSEGDTYPVWWETGQRSADGTPVAKVMGVRPYISNVAHDAAKQQEA